MSILNICFTTNDKWVRQVQRAIYDIIIRKNSNTGINFFVLCDNFDGTSYFEPFLHVPNITVRTQNIDTQLEFNYKIAPYYYDWIGPFKHLKFLIPDLELFKDVDKVLYLDVDMLARKDLTPLYEYDLENYALGAVRDYSHLRMPNFADIFRVCNKIESGMYLMNLRKLRKLGFTEKCKIETQRFCGDLPVMESVGLAYMKFLDPKWQIPYHFMCSESIYRDINRWNEYTGSEYESIEELVQASFLWHYCGDKEVYYETVPHVKDSFDLSEERLAEFLKTGVVMDWKPSDDDILTINATTGEEYVQS